MGDLAFKSAVDLAAMLAAREVSARELLDYYLARVERFNPDLNAIIALDEEGARAAADAADAAIADGSASGPLHGVPMTIKESYDVAGMPTTFGNPQFADNIAETDSVPVERLKRAGVVLFGKSNVPLALADFQSYNEVYGQTNNPWNPARTPGGSSGGSAAVLAAGLAGFEAGSDIGGSIRNPSHFCGVFGHKPTWGVVAPRGHALPGILARPDLSVVGPMARSAADLAVGFEAMAGPDTIDAVGWRLDLPRPTGASLKDLRVAVWANDEQAPVSSETERRVMQVADAIRDAGGSVDVGARPDFTASHAHDVYQTLLQAAMNSRTADADYAAMQARVAELDPDDTSERAMTLRRQTATARDVANANEARTHLRWAWHHLFQEYDAVIAPIMATPAFEHDHRPFGQRTIRVDDAERPYFEQVFWAGLAIASYLPSTVIPTGPDADGLPIGVQIIGREYGDYETIGVARLLELAGFEFQAPPGYGD